MSFTAHNIRLPDGSLTFSEVGYTVDQYEWFKAAKRIIRATFPSLHGVSLVDLGCLEGGYTLEFAKLGIRALGLEVRQSNFENCLLLKDLFPIENLAYVKDNAWNLPSYGSHDVTFCCGLLYHLDRPRSFIKMLGECTKRLLVIQTHFADEQIPESFKLSPITQHEGLEGRWYREYDGTMSERDLEKLRWTSWENSNSFWLKRSSLLQAISEAGFDTVLEQFDGLGQNIVHAMGEDGIYQKMHRGTFIGIKT